MSKCERSQAEAPVTRQATWGFDHLNRSTFSGLFDFIYDLCYTVALERSRSQTVRGLTVVAKNETGKPEASNNDGKLKSMFRGRRRGEKNGSRVQAVLNLDS